MKRLGYSGGFAPDHDEIGAGGGVGVLALLLPIAQRAERDLEPRRKILLRKSERGA